MKKIIFVSSMLLLALGVSGCANKMQTGAAIGAGSGALIGQAIGHDTGATLVGAAIGGIAGAAIGHNEDKKDYYR